MNEQTKMKRMIFVGITLILSSYICHCVPHDVKHYHSPANISQRITLRASSSKCDLSLEKKEVNCSYKYFAQVPEDLTPDISVLNLDHNAIPALLNDSFRRYTSLTKLSVESNKLRYIELRSLYPLRRLVEINLSHNPNLIMHTGAIFRYSEHLSRIDLSHCDLYDIPHDILKWFTHVDFLDISNNRFSYVNITACGKIKYLELLGDQQNFNLTRESYKIPCKIDLLEFNAKGIQTIDPYTIATMDVQNLSLLFGLNQRLQTSNNLFTGITQSTIKRLTVEYFILDRRNLSIQVFNTLRNKVLDKLTVRGLRLVDPLYPNVFSGLNMVKQLSWSNNHRRMTDIEPAYFNGMDSLEKLALESNDIVTITQQPSTSIWTIDLKELSLASNKLKAIHQYTFCGLHNLTSLDLSWNTELVSVEITSFSHLPLLQYLDVSYTNLKRFELYAPQLRLLSCDQQETFTSSNILISSARETFNRTDFLESISFGGSQVLLPDCPHGTVFERLHKLRLLDLSDNSFFDNDGLLSSVSISQDSALLTELYLSNCGIKKSLGYATFKGLHSLRFLDLSSNQIPSINHDTFRAVCSLRILYLNRNSLVSIEDMSFSNLTLLKELFLGDNKLVYLSNAAFRWIEPSLTSIDLSNNPIKCSCDLIWLIKWLGDSLNLVDEKHTVCSLTSIESLREKSLKTFQPDELCQPNIILPCFIPIIVVATVLAVVVIHHNRWWFHFQFFLLKLAIFGYREIQDARDHRDFEFDLNIMFIDNNEEWVRDHLRPFVEEQLPDFDRVVYGDGDLILGMHILDAVDYVVQRSYKTVVLFSRRAVQDNWFLIKFRTAMDHVADVQMENLVVIFLEDIPDAELPFLVRLYLSDRRSHLLWVEDEHEEGQEYFWKELLKDLTINLKRNNLIPPE